MPPNPEHGSCAGRITETLVRGVVSYDVAGSRKLCPAGFFVETTAACAWFLFFGVQLTSEELVWCNPEVHVAATLPCVQRVRWSRFNTKPVEFVEVFRDFASSCLPVALPCGSR